MADKALKLAVSAALVEVTLQIVVLIASGTLTGAPLRVAFLAAKVPFCWLTAQRRPGAYLAVWVYEIAAVAAAVGVRGPALTRIAFGVGAVLVMVLLGRASSAFPPVEWKSR